MFYDCHKPNVSILLPTNSHLLQHVETRQCNHTPTIFFLASKLHWFKTVCHKALKTLHILCSNNLTSSGPWLFVQIFHKICTSWHGLYTKVFSTHLKIVKTTKDPKQTLVALQKWLVLNFKIFTTKFCCNYNHAFRQYSYRCWCFHCSIH